MAVRRRRAARRCRSGATCWRTSANALGVAYAPSALFAVAFGFVLLLLLHFSLVISRLADQNKVLAQKLGQLQQRVDDLEQAATTTADPAEPADQAEPAPAPIARP